MMKCIGCGRKPDQIIEYVVYAEEHDITPVEYVVRFESTYNTFEPGKFYCTACYIEAGMPLIQGVCEK